MSEGSAISIWSKQLLRGAKKIGRPLDSAKHYKDELTRVGYVDIVEDTYKWPMNRWPRDRNFKELGMF